MSRPVRVRGDVAARVEAAALGERRSFANMVEVLLLLGLDVTAGVARAEMNVRPVAGPPVPGGPPPERVFRPDPKGKT